MFCTVLRELKSPLNTAMIVRSHVALGGGPLVIVGSEPWRFRKRAQSFSRRLERVAEILYLADDDALFDWCAEQAVAPVAVEIQAPPTPPAAFDFPERVAILLGHEGTGLPATTLARCAGCVTIPQHGPIASLNVAMAAGIVMYEIQRDRPATRPIEGRRFDVPIAERARLDR